MSKELEALKFLWEYINPKESWQEYPDLLETFNIIEAALKEVSGEDRAILKHIKNGRLHPLTTKCYQRLLDKEKALQIIKEKRVNISLFFSTNSLNSYNDYIAHCRGAGIVKEAQLLTQENYDFLKKVLS